MKTNHLIDRFFGWTLAAFVLFFVACDKGPENDIDPNAQQLNPPVVRIDNVTTTTIEVSWGAVDHATGYAYRLGEGEERRVEASILRVTFQGLTPATSYTVQVRALAGKGYTDSDWRIEEVTTEGGSVVETVDIPDPVLKAWLLAQSDPVIDADGDGQISCEEAARVTVIEAGYESAEEAGGNVICDLTGLERFTALERLGLKFHQVVDVAPIERLERLTYLNLGENPVETIDLSHLTALTDLRLYGTFIYELDLSKNLQLKELYLQRTGIKTLDLTPFKQLEGAYINYTDLQTLRAVELAKLVRLDAVQCRLNRVEVTDCAALQQLHLNTNVLQEATLRNLPELQLLNIYGNQLAALDLTGFPKLVMLAADDNRIATLNLKQNPELVTLMISRNALQTIDLSANSKIATLYATHMPGLVEINLRNEGYDEYAEYDIAEGNAMLRRVVVDEGAEYDHVTRLFAEKPGVSVVTE